MGIYNIKLFTFETRSPRFPGRKGRQRTRDRRRRVHPPRASPMLCRPRRSKGPSTASSTSLGKRGTIPAFSTRSWHAFPNRGTSCKRVFVGSLQVCLGDSNYVMLIRLFTTLEMCCFYRFCVPTNLGETSHSKTFRK